MLEEFLAQAGVVQGEIDAAFFVSAPDAEAIQTLLRAPKINLMSFSHAEDLDIVSQCLLRQRERQDLPFIGLIGSQTKWAVFQRRLRARGYSEAELMDGVLNDNWRSLMRFQLQRARDWFARSEAGVRWLAPDARWPVWASLRLYRGILDVIETLDYDVFKHRAFVPTAGKFLDLPRSFVIAQAR